MTHHKTQYIDIQRALSESSACPILQFQLGVKYGHSGHYLPVHRYLDRLQFFGYVIAEPEESWETVNLAVSSDPILLEASPSIRLHVAMPLRGVCHVPSY